MPHLNPLKFLSRPDKHFLGGGNRLLWAPPFPVWLDYPGFWDSAHYYNYETGPVFTWTLLDDDGNEVFLSAEGRNWDPSKLTTRYRVSDVGYRQRQTSNIQHPTSWLVISETKTCLPTDVLASIIRMKNTSRTRQRLHLIAWTTQPSYPTEQTTWITDVGHENATIRFTRHIRHPHNSNIPLFHFSCALGLDRKPKSFSVSLSEGSVLQPHWKLTPFFESFRKKKLPDDVKLHGVNDDGLLFMALHASIELRAKSEDEIAIHFAVAPEPADATSNSNVARKQKDPIKVSESNWEEFFSRVPYFECSDEFVTRYYWYRWYGLRLMMIDGQEGNYKHPAVCEGIGYFRAPISYSAPCHMLETRWMHDPRIAQGSLLNFIDNQRDDGGFRGYLDVNNFRQEMFYHAHWGKALKGLTEIHPDNEYLKRVYDGLSKYVAYFDRERDPEGSGMYNIDNHYETGQEYTRRYMVVNPDADKDNWGDVFRLKGVDVSVYLYELKKCLAWIAQELELGNGIMEGWSNGARKTKEAILGTMWDPEEEMFFDTDPATGKRTMVKAATCFYPYMTDIVSESYVPGFMRHLFNPDEFWTPFPVPSSSVDDEYFSPTAEWKGKRMNCPWNGRVWPMTNSHIAEALAQTAIRFNSQELRARSVEFITKFIRMMFYRTAGDSRSGRDGDPARPNCFEHYNPFTGAPGIYRGVDDYMHSWVVDLIVKYVAGVRVSGNKLVIDPFPFPLGWFELREVIVQGRRVKVQRKGNMFRVFIDGKKAGESHPGQPIIIDLSHPS